MAKCLDCILSLFKPDDEVKASPTLDELKTHFENATIDDLIDSIKELLEINKGLKTKHDNPSTSSESASTKEKPLFKIIGGKFLKILNRRMEQMAVKVDLFQSDGEVPQVVSEILEQVGKTHWTVAGLSMIGYLLSKKGKILKNQAECLDLLQHMFELASHIKNVKHLLQQEAEMPRKALDLIAKGSMICASQLKSKNFFRFMTSSLNSQKLKRLRSDIKDRIRILLLTDVTVMLQQQPVRVSITKPLYPAQAVGIDKRFKEVKGLLQMDTKDESFRAVVIYGFGGIGKTYLAKAVYSKLNLKNYNYSRVVMDIDPWKNDIKKKQEQILKDAFPNYNSGRVIDLRDQQEGRELLKNAFKDANKPVFLFIDNALRAEDLRELLPQDLESLRKHIRLLLTTRNLNVTNLFKKGLCHEYLVKPLPDGDAKKILFTDTHNLIQMKDDVDRILKICNGVPLVLKIVGAHLENHGYRADKCIQILNALQTGEVVKEQNLSERMVDFVFDKFENFTQEAFLDICCFFNGMNRTQVEYAVGSMALKTLEDTALITIKSDPEYYPMMQGNADLVVVHDVIKARGQNMARSTRIKNIQSLEAAEREKRLDKIKGIRLFCGKDHSSYVFKEELLNSISKSLRVLMLGPDISVSATSHMTFPELRLVHLNSNIPSLPFRLETLETLAVYRGPLLESVSKLPQSLRVIRTFKSNVEGTNWDRSKLMKVASNSSLEEIYFDGDMEVENKEEKLKVIRRGKWQGIQ